MDLQTWINLGGTAGLTILGWLLTAQRKKQETVDARHDQIAKELTAFQIKVAENYVTTHDLSDIKTTLVRIETKLDAKADK